MESKSDEQRNLMLTAPIGKLLAQKSIPTVIIQLITVIYNTADTYFVAQINTSASAAVGVVFSLMAIIQAVGYGIGMGTASIVSIALGEKKEIEAEKYAASAVSFSVVLGLLIMLFGMVFKTGFIRILGASDTVLPYALDYAQYILIVAPFMCGAFVLNNILRASGQTTLSMIGMTSGGILNLILDPIFIFSLNLGIKGAALATMLGQILSFVLMLFFFLQKKSIVALDLRNISKSVKDYLTIIKTGAPSVFRQGLSSIASAVLNNCAMPYGDATVAAITISNKVYTLIRGVILGIGQGYMPIAGYCYGAGKKQRVRKFFKACCLAGTIIAVGSAICMFFFRTQIITWFRNDPDVIAIGSQTFIFLSMSLPFMAYSTYVNQTYQSLKHALGATILASCRQGIFFIPIAFILPPILKVTGIELLQPVADTLTFLISIPFQIVFFKKYLSKDDEETAIES